MDKELLRETKQRLLDMDVLFIKGDVDGEQVHWVLDALTYLEAKGSPDIEVRIMSHGGDVSAGLDIYDFMVKYPGRKRGVVYSYAESMAAVILQACEERVALAHSTVLIHHINVSNLSLDVLRNKPRLQAEIDSMERDQEQIYAILAKKTSRKIRTIQQACKRDRPMSATEALAFGLIDNVAEG